VDLCKKNLTLDQYIIPSSRLTEEPLPEQLEKTYLKNVDKDKQMTLSEIDSTYGPVLGIWEDLIHDIKIPEGLSEQDFDITISFTELENGEAIKKIEKLKKELQKEKSELENKKESTLKKIKNIFNKKAKKIEIINKKITYLNLLKPAVETFQKEYIVEKKRLDKDEIDQKELEERLDHLKDKLTSIQQISTGSNTQNESQK
jgi:hypothetical protein